jgi:hypothetical protein
MTTIEEYEARADSAAATAEAAHKVYLQSLAEQWRELATSKVQDLVVRKQPEVTERHGDQIARFKKSLTEIIDIGADRVEELFLDHTKPIQFVSSDGRVLREAESSVLSGPIRTLAKPLHEFLAAWGYNPDLIKANMPRASYSRDAFTDSDFPLPSIEIKRTYREALTDLCNARTALVGARRSAASAAAADLWNNS